MVPPVPAAQPWVGELKKTALSAAEVPEVCAVQVCAWALENAEYTMKIESINFFMLNDICVLNMETVLILDGKIKRNTDSIPRVI